MHSLFLIYQVVTFATASVVSVMNSLHLKAILIIPTAFGVANYWQRRHSGHVVHVHNEEVLEDYADL